MITDLENSAFSIIFTYIGSSYGAWRCTRTSESSPTAPLCQCPLVSTHIKSMTNVKLCSSSKCDLAYWWLKNDAKSFLHDKIKLFLHFKEASITRSIAITAPICPRWAPNVRSIFRYCAAVHHWRPQRTLTVYTAPRDRTQHHTPPSRQDAHQWSRNSSYTLNAVSLSSQNIHVCLSKSKITCRSKHLGWIIISFYRFIVFSFRFFVF